MNDRKQCEVCKAVLAHNRKHPNILYDMLTGGNLKYFYVISVITRLFLIIKGV